MKEHSSDRRAGTRSRRLALVHAGLALAIGLARPASAGDGASDRQQGLAERPFTLGVVQKGLRPGLSQADVAERLGSPNIVTRDAEGREAWVYDKVSSALEASRRGIGVGGVGSGTAGSFWGLLGIGGGASSEKTRSSQRTLTVVVRFTAEGAVETFSWHLSRF